MGRRAIKECSLGTAQPFHGLTAVVAVCTGLAQVWACQSRMGEEPLGPYPSQGNHSLLMDGVQGSHCLLFLLPCWGHIATRLCERFHTHGDINSLVKLSETQDKDPGVGKGLARVG